MAVNDKSSWDIIRNTINATEIGTSIPKSKLREVVMFYKRQSSSIATAYNYVNLLLKNGYLKALENSNKYVVLKHLDEETKVTDLQNAYNKPEKSVMDVQIGGSHYKKYAYQPIELYNDCCVSFIQGSIIKYIVRYADKNGNEDLNKIIHYSQLAIELNHIGVSDKKCGVKISRFVDENNLDDIQVEVIKCVFNNKWHDIIKIVSKMIK